MTVGKAVGQRIKDLCEQKKITINRLAVRSGLAQSTINNIMDGSSKNPTIYTIYKICKGFDIKITEFFEPEWFEELEGDSF